MTSKERVRTTIQHKQPDRAPANFECVPEVMEKLLKHYGYREVEQLLERFQIDIRGAEPPYIGPELRSYQDSDGLMVTESFWGFRQKRHWTGIEYNNVTVYHPLDECTTAKEIEEYQWPSADWFDYDEIKRQCEQHHDKAIIIGHPGPFQMACNLRSMEKLCMDMAGNPELAHAIYDKMVEFELEYYERMLIAADGQIDILRPHDDYGTQQSLLFSVRMWRKYFQENTRKLADLAHKYGAFYQQHSCGAVRKIIPELIDCGVDILEPLQKLPGLEPDVLKQEFGDRIAFHGGIDTQGILPFGTPEEVKQETEHYIDILNMNGGYILMASQSFEGDVSIENIEALYSVDRT